MSLQYDPEFVKLAGKQALDRQKERIPVHDVNGRRDRIEAFIRTQKQPQLPADIEQNIYHAKASDNHEVSIYHFRKKSVATSDPGPALVHIHGGGYICLGAADSAPSLAAFVMNTGVPMFSIDYRLAPENTFPVPLEDCWAALVWLQSHAKELKIDVNRIAIMGESAGGGLAAGLTLLARDRGFSPPIAKQILVYPMLDDRTTTDFTEGQAIFGVDDVITGWAAYLGSAYGTDNVSHYAAPARVKDVKGLPRLYMDCGQLDCFAYEDSEYFLKFLRANIPAEFHLYDGVPHAFQRFAPTSAVAKQAVGNRMAAMMNF